MENKGAVIKAGPNIDYPILRQRAVDILHGLGDMRIPAYRIKKIRGTLIVGGYGDVYKARLRTGTMRLGPDVMAVKMLRPQGTGEERVRVLAALARELHVWRRLKHPNLLALEGFTFNENEFNKAWILTRWQANGNVLSYVVTTDPDLHRRLELACALDTAHGLAWLHSLSPAVCHGDIKAENTLVSHSGRAMLCDFGLAKVLADVPSGLTTSKETSYTPRYASPELVGSDDVTHTLASDVWAWGCLVSVIMINDLPYKDKARNNQILQAIKELQLPADLSQSAFKPPEFVSRLLQACWQPVPESRATMARCLADLSAGFFRTSATSAINSTITQYKITGSGWYMLRNPVVTQTIDLDLLSVSDSHNTGSRKYKFSPDGRYIIIADRYTVTVYITSTATKHSVLDVPAGSDGVAPNFASEICFNESGTLLGVGYISGIIQLWHFPQQARYIQLRGHEQAITSLLFSHKDQRLVSASLDRTIRVWDAEKGSTLHTIPAAATGPAKFLVASPQHSLVMASCNQLLRICDVSDGRVVTDLEASADAIAFTPSGNRILTGGQDLGLQEWDLRSLLSDSISQPSSPTEIADQPTIVPRLLTGTQSAISSLGISSDGQIAVSASGNLDDVALWDLSSGEVLTLLRGTRIKRLPHIALSPLSTATSGSIVLRTSDAFRLVNYRISPQGVPLPTAKSSGGVSAVVRLVKELFTFVA